MYEDDKANQALTDEEVLSIAGKKKCALLTANRKHFIQLHRRQPNHGGIIVCTFDPDFIRQAERIAEALRDQESLENEAPRLTLCFLMTKQLDSFHIKFYPTSDLGVLIGGPKAARKGLLPLALNLTL